MIGPGKVTFGEGCVVHPSCTIIAEGGDIHIGEYNIFEERVRIINRAKKDEQGKLIKRDMHIGNYNIFEVYA
jgi:acetyltransferase-like isoleucine patch superfamily enzyme